MATIVDKNVCRFGVDGQQATRTIALVGDSHAGMWRLPLDHVARALGWYGVRIGHSSCPLSAAVRDLPEPNRSHCARWKEETFLWLDAHPEISVVVVSNLTGGSGVVPARGRSAFDTAVAGYVGAWDRLPATVRQIVVIRDTPKARAATDACVERAIAARRRAGPTCAVPRSLALDADPAVAAARRTDREGVQVLDLTDIFCGPRTCEPVIGGALVHKDTTHLTEAFAASLGEPLLRRVRPLAEAWR